VERQNAAIVGIVDLTDRKQTELALRNSETRYCSLLNIMPDGVRVNRDGQVLYANEAEAKLLGAASPDELIRRPSNLMPSEELEKMRLRQGMLDRQEISDWHQSARIRLDGSRVEVESTAQTAVSANSAKSKFLTTMSHEIRRTAFWVWEACCWKDGWTRNNATRPRSLPRSVRRF
jgi:PAS domain S-box-containing protein